MLTLDKLTAGYGPVTALQDVTFSAGKGQITAVLGANGAGKTTLLRTVSGLHRPESGTISLDGQPLRKVNAEQMPALGMVHVPEGRGVITELTIEENLRLGGLAHRHKNHPRQPLPRYRRRDLAAPCRPAPCLAHFLRPFYDLPH